MGGAEGQVADQVGLRENQGDAAAVQDAESFTHWGPPLAYIDEKWVTRSLQQGVVQGHDKDGQSEHRGVVARPKGNILHEIGVIVDMVGHQAERFVDVHLRVRGQSPIDQFANRVVVSL